MAEIPGQDEAQRKSRKGLLGSGKAGVTNLLTGNKGTWWEVICIVSKRVKG